jgi:drug/metabolite transporter (DMT)-like permease
MTVILGLGAALSWGLLDLQLYRLGRMGVHPLLAMAWALAVGLAVGLPIALAVDGVPPADWKALAGAAAAGVFYMWAFACFMFAVERGASLSVVSPIVGLEGGIAAFIAIALGEHVNPLIAAALVAAVIGGVLTAAEPGRRTAIGVGWALAAAIAFAVVFVLFAATEPIGALMAVMVARVAGLVVLIPVLAWLRPARVPAAARRRAAIAGILDVAGFTLFAAAVVLGPVSVASVTAAQFSAVSVLIAIVLLHERPAPWQLGGIVTMLVAVSLLATA